MYTVTATGSGTGTVDVDTDLNGGIEANALGDGGDAESGSFTVDHTGGNAPVLDTTADIKFGEPVLITVPSQAGFSLQVTDVAGGTLAGHPLAAVDCFVDQQISVTLPLSAFLDASGVTTLTLTVDWVVTNTMARRELRGLQQELDVNGMEEGEAGTMKYDIEVGVVPLEDGSYAYVTKTMSLASMAAAGAALLL